MNNGDETANFSKQEGASMPQLIPLLLSMVILQVALCFSFVLGLDDIYREREKDHKDVYFLGSALNDVFLLQCNMGVGICKRNVYFC